MSSGGARPGSGRKPLAPGQRRETVTLKVSPLTRQIMNRMRGEGMLISREVDDMFLEFADDLGWMTHDEEGNPVALIEENNK